MIIVISMNEDENPLGQIVTVRKDEPPKPEEVVEEPLPVHQDEPQLQVVTWC